MRLVMILTVLTLFACLPKTNEREQAKRILTNVNAGNSQDAYLAQDVDTTSFKPVIGERIDGPANVRDGINGMLLFTLNDNVLVSATSLEEGWYRIGLLMDIEPGGLETRKIKQGQNILINGSVAGEIQADMSVYPNPDQGNKAELMGYTHKDNIKPASIIEKALSDYLQSGENGRSLRQMHPFIRNFALDETNQFEGYNIYYNYETWLDDPSPMWRIGLVFQGEKLTAVLHSRPISLSDGNNYDLARGYGCFVYMGVENADEIANMLNDFVSSVD